MKVFDWNENKNDWLKNTRDISFEEIIQSIDDGDLLDVVVNPDIKNYPFQKVLIVWIKNYVYLVPFIELKDKYFLKTAYPSRKAMKKYGRK